MLEFGHGHATKVNTKKGRPPHIARIPKGARSINTPLRRYDVITADAPLVSYSNGPDTVRSLKPFTIRVVMPNGKIKFIQSKHEDEK